MAVILTHALLVRLMHCYRLLGEVFFLDHHLVDFKNVAILQDLINVGSVSFLCQFLKFNCIFIQIFFVGCNK